MVTASVLAVAWGARDREKPRPPAPTRAAEVPWLSKEAAAQIVGPEGTLGPLFANVMLGGLAPSPEERARIEEFARANRVKIDLEVDDDQLVAIRFDVTYGGCCGYEGAEVLALRARRPHRGGGCTGGDPTWINHWAITHDDGTYLRARVDLNRVVFRWERALTTEELLERADATLGLDTAKLARTAGDRWRSLSGGVFVLEVPYRQDTWDYEYVTPEQLGMTITADRGRVGELSMRVRTSDDASIEDSLKAHWGRPSVHDSTWTWRKGDRIIEADVVDMQTVTVTMRRRSA